MTAGFVGGNFENEQTRIRIALNCYMACSTVIPCASLVEKIDLDEPFGGGALSHEEESCATGIGVGVERRFGEGGVDWGGGGGGGGSKVGEGGEVAP